MDAFSFWLFILLVFLPSLGVVFLVRYLVDMSAFETEIDKKFKEKKYTAIIADIEKWKGMPLSPNTSLLAARAYAALAKNEDALKQYNTILSKVSANHQLRFPALCESAEILYKKNQFKASEKSLRAALAIQPGNPLGNFLLAQVLYVTDRAQEALGILNSLLNDFSQEVQAMQLEIRALIAEVLAYLGLYDKARAHYEALDKAGKKADTALYAKTMKECAHYDKALASYLYLIGKKHNAADHAPLVLDCAQVYYDSENFKEGLLFTEEQLPSLEGKDKALLRYRRALFLEALGDDFAALQEFSEIQDELREEPQIAEAVRRWGDVLTHPQLKRYYTSDSGLFEKFIEKILPAGAAVTRRTREFYICTKGTSAWVFYRRYLPISERVLENIDKAYPSSCFRAGIIDILSFHGAEQEVRLSRGVYTALIISGDSFLNRIAPAHGGRG